MFEAVASGCPHSKQSPVQVYNGQGFHLRYGLAQSTINQSRDTKREVDQGHEIAKIALLLLCEGKQAIAPVSSEFRGEDGTVPLVGSDRKPRPRLAEQCQGVSLRSRPAQRPP